MKTRRLIAFVTALCLFLGCGGFSALVSADADPTPEDLGYTRYTLKDLGIADNTYSSNAVVARQGANGLNDMYLDVNVALGYKPDGTADPYTGIKIGHKSASSWDGIRIGLDTGDKLTVRCAQTNKELFAVTKEQAGVNSFTKTFNLKVATKIAASSVSGCMDVTISLWINNKLIKQEEKIEALPGIGDYAGVLTWNGASVTVGTPDGSTPDVPAPKGDTPEELGFTRFTLSELGIADGTYNTNAVTTKDTGGLNGKYLDVDVSFGYKPDGTADASTGIKIGNTAPASWDGIKIGLIAGDKLTVNFTTTNYTAFTLTTAEAGVDTFTETFNLKFATKMEPNAGKTDVTITMWINDQLVKQDVLVGGMGGIGNYAGILSWNGAGVTVATPEERIPEETEPDVTEPEGDTPEALGFTRYTLNELGIADGTYNTNAVTTRDAGDLNGKYLDVDVSFGYKPDGTADASTGIKIGNTAPTSWDGIKIGLIAGDKLAVNFTTTNYTAFTLTTAEAGVDTFTETFNLKFATKMEPNAGKTDVTITMWINDKLVKQDVLVGGMGGIGNYAGILSWNGAGVTVATPEERIPEETEPDVTEPEGDTPEALGFTRYTLNELGIADGTYNTNAVTTRDAGDLNGKYLDVDVSFGYKPDGTADASTGIKIGNTAPTSWDGIKIGLIAGDKLAVNFTTTNYTAFTLTTADAGVETFTETFNLKFATKMEPNAGKTDVTIWMWINDKLVKKNVMVGGMGGIGNYAGILSWNGAGVTVASPAASTPDEPATGTPEEMGYTMVTLKNQFAIADGTYNTNAVNTSPYPKGLNNTCLNVDVAFHYKPDGTADASSGIKYGNTAPTSWDGIKIGLLEGDRLTVNYTATNFEIFTLTTEQAGVDTFTEIFNLKFAVKIDESGDRSDVTITMWINDKLIKKDVFVGGLSAVGNCGGILTWNGAGVTVGTPQGSDTGTELDERVPDYENPPGQMGGKTWSGSYITAVDTQNSTTVISMADTDNGYKTQADYTAYGLDYVMDLNVDRQLKILQITDTQIIDAAQCRTDDRLLDFQKANWATDKMYNNAFRYIVKAVNDTKPDLILLTGDIMYGEFDDNGTALMALINFMDSLQIPWAPIFGNHENESEMGVAWQSQMLEESPYCLFVRRNDIGGNGNYSVGIAKNGQLQRVVYMMDTNGCRRSSNLNGTQVKTTVGFTKAQKQWLLDAGLQVQEAAGKTVPAFIGYHIPTQEVLLAAQNAGYQSGEDSVDITYTIGVDVTAQPGDSGYKGDLFEGIHDSEGLLEIMKHIGVDGAFFGHAHLNSTSVLYEGIRWTFGLKTGTYDKSPEILGGTLITINADNTFTVEQTQTTAQEIAAEYPNRIYTPPVVESGPVVSEKEELPEDFTKISFHSFDVDNGTYGTAISLSVQGQYKETLDRTLFSGDVIFNNVGGFMTYAGGASAWHGMRIEPQSNGTLLISEAELKFPQVTITPEQAGTKLVGEQFNLKITTEFIEADHDGLKNDVKFGIWINDVLYKNQYIYAADYVDTIGGYMGIYCPNEGTSVTVDAGEIDYGTPITPDPSLKVISFSSFGVKDDSYGYNENTLAITGNYYNPQKGRSLDGTLLAGYMTFADGTDIRVGGKDNPWLGIYLLAVGEELHLYANDTRYYTFRESSAGIKLVGEELKLELSIVYADTDSDGAKDDVQLGVWFNGVLYKNRFIDLPDVAPTLGSMMGIYSAFQGNDLTIKSVAVDNNADLSIFGFDKNYEDYLDRTGKPRAVRTEL